MTSYGSRDASSQAPVEGLEPERDETYAHRAVLKREPERCTAAKHLITVTANAVKAITEGVLTQA